MEHDPNIEGFFEPDPEPVTQIQNVPTQATKPTVKEQFEALGSAVQSGAYQIINPSTFPDVLPNRLFAEKVLAFDNHIDRLQWAANNTPNPEVARKLAIMASESENAGMVELEQTVIIKGDIDPDLLRRQLIVRQSGDANAMMERIIGRGLLEDLTEHNFPALRGMDPASRYSILMDVVENRIRFLKEKEAQVAHVLGYSADGSSLEKTILEDHIRECREFYRKLIKKYSAAVKWTNLQVPEFE